jgi:endonuclease/exonuclease/phosphatase family metal-dependent hydrolase
VSPIPVALFNFEGGGLQPDGTFAHDKLCRAFEHVDRVPALVAICEAKEWGRDGNRGLLAATQALGRLVDRPYVGQLGWRERGPIEPALLYDPTVLAPITWYNDNGYPTHDDKRGLVEFTVRGTDVRLGVLVEHWDPRSGATRLRQAERIDRYGKHRLPMLVMGDLNSTASGPSYPKRDWAVADYRARHQKARELDGGTWVDQTEAVDHLIGAWSDDHGERLGGCGFHAATDLAWLGGTPHHRAYEPTVNRGIDEGGGQIIDFILTNAPESLVPMTYKVHVPPGDNRADLPSDHRLVTASFDFEVPST